MEKVAIRGINILACKNECEFVEFLMSEHEIKTGKLIAINAEKIIVAEKLGIKKNDEIIRDITDFFINNSVPIEFPTFNVWADEIETGLEEIMCDPVPENVQKFLDSTSE